MEVVKIKLSALWAAAMFIYQQGDVMRLYSGDFMPGGDVGGIQVTQAMWLGMNELMSIPVVMIILSLVLKYKANRWTNIIFAVVFFGINLMGLPTYPSAYDKLLLILSMGFNVLTVCHAWKWLKPEVLK